MLFKHLNIHHFWQKRYLINYFLQPLSLLWILLSLVRRLFSKPYHSTKFIICVGNINLGGAGKTPTCIHIGKELTKKGYKVCFLSSAYGGKFKKTQLINPTMSSSICGDEALLLSSVLPTFISKSLKNGIKFIENYSDNFDIIILDDRYQNPSLIKDFNLLVTNGHYGFGNAMIFPAGPLRESIKSGFNKADMVLILEDDKYGVAKLVHIYDKPSVIGYYEATNLSDLKGDYLAFCGIGIPQKFIHTLTKNNVSIKKTIFFKDHHNYSNAEIENLIKIATENNLKLITTTKDYIKIDKKYKNTIQFLEIKLKLEDEELINLIINYYNEKNSK